MTVANTPQALPHASVQAAGEAVQSLIQMDCFVASRRAMTTKDSKLTFAEVLKCELSCLQLPALLLHV